MPKEVIPYINVLDEYEEVDNLTSINLIHMYPLGLAYPDGYWDSQFFKVIAFSYENPIQKQKCDLGRHDGLKFEDGVEVDIARIFADGSTLLRFKHPVTIEGGYCFQCLILTKK